MVAELLGIPRGEEHLVHVDELDRGQSAIGTVLFEPLIPLHYGVLGVVGVVGQELNVFLGQAVLRLLSGNKHV